MPPLLAAGLCPSELPMPLPVLDHRLAPAEGLDVDGIVCMDCRSRCCASASQVCRLRWVLEGRTSASEVARLREDTSSCCHARDLTPVMETSQYLQRLSMSLHSDSPGRLALTLLWVQAEPCLMLLLRKFERLLLPAQFRVCRVHHKRHCLLASTALHACSMTHSSHHGCAPGRAAPHRFFNHAQGIRKIANHHLLRMEG